MGISFQDRSTAPAGRHSNASQPAKRRIPTEFITSLISSADILDVVSSRLPNMKRSGSSASACCPFHQEKSPSFTVSQTRQTYHCFGCSAHGNALKFIIEYDGLRFVEAVHELASMVGMRVPQEEGQEPVDHAHSKAQESASFDRMQTAMQFFRHCLAHTDEAKEYLKSRGMTAATANIFQIGYAPPEWQGLKEAFPQYETDELLSQVGLIRISENERRYDWFRHRIMFPVRDIRGRVVGFGGRKMPSDQSDMAKYINSPDSPLFNKTQTLYGLFEAKEGIREHKSAVIMEGYTDVILTRQAGINNAVASMGTACTEEHIKRLKQLGAKTICFCFDGDTAGKNAAWKAMRNCMPLIEDEVHFTFAFMPEGKDPDEVIRERGAEEFLKLIESASQLVEYMLSELKIKHNNLLTTDDRANFLNDGESLIRIMPYRSRFRDMAKKQMSDMTGIRLVAVREQNRVVPPTFRKSPAHTTWGRLQKAVERAPNTALEFQEALLDMLNPSDDDQLGLIESLKNVQARDEEDDAIYAEDIRSADALIERHLNQLQRDQLRQMFVDGKIASADYVMQLSKLSA